MSNLDDQTLVGAAFSLYFQWPAHRKSIIYATMSDSYLECEMSYDTDERFPTEIRIKLSQPIPPDSLSNCTNVRVRFEIFRTCYEFNAQVLAIGSQADDGWDAVISVPPSILIFKARRLPRIRIDESKYGEMPTAVWVTECSDSEKVRILEMGMMSLMVEGEKTFNDVPGKLMIDGTVFNSEIRRIDGKKAIVSIHFRDGIETGKYFDSYKKIAYPMLRSRNDLTTEDVLKLFQDSGYLDKFSGTEDDSKILAEIEETWNNLAPAQHESTADYCTIGNEGQLTGSSSSTLAFRDGEVPIWAFHQLCAIKGQNSIVNSGALYAWRAEYLAARPEELKAVTWYCSSGRWIERMYTKFATITTQDVKLHAVDMFLHTFSNDNECDETKAESYKVGTSDRIVFSTPMMFAGANPPRLNASGALDSIVVTDEIVSEAEISGAAKNIMRISAAQSKDFFVTATKGNSLGFDRTRMGKSDRFLSFPKCTFADFLSSVEHSVAVSIRKAESL